MAAQRTYLAIDLKSFYASVECIDRHLDPLTTNLWWRTPPAPKRPSALRYHPP